MRLKAEQWTIGHLRAHLQAAVDLEFWTIPFYMSAMYSVVDRASDAFQVIQTVVNQEMLHVQLAANIANAFGLSPKFAAPVYTGTRIPHLNFALDNPEFIGQYLPYSAEIGPLDAERINGMCLVEVPEWDTGNTPDLHDTVTEYGSIGAFYQAVSYGAGLLKDHLRGGINQVNHFAAFYNGLPPLVVADSGEVGLRQVGMLVNTICEQGEGQPKGREEMKAAYQNTADDSWQSQSHFQKFNMIRDQAAKALTYPVKPESDWSARDKAIQAALVENFSQFRAALEHLFAGKNPENFVPLMISVGAGIQNCWKNGVTPRFS